jgi:hypothetical protein
MLLHIGLSVVLGYVVSDLPQSDQHVISALTAEDPAQRFIASANSWHKRCRCGESGSD